MEILPDETSSLEYLIEKSIAGDYRAFKILYDSLSGKMYSLCLRYIPAKEEAADVFQDSFVKFFSSLHNFRFEGSFEGWARKIFVSNCLDFLKKKKILLLEVNENLNVAEQQLNILWKLDLEDLVKLIQKLPEGQRIVFNLYEIEGYSHKEIAEMLQIPVGSSKSQLHRAKMSLKNLLSGTTTPAY